MISSLLSGLPGVVAAAHSAVTVTQVLEGLSRYAAPALGVALVLGLLLGWLAGRAGGGRKRTEPAPSTPPGYEELKWSHQKLALAERRLAEKQGRLEGFVDRCLRLDSVEAQALAARVFLLAERLRESRERVASDVSRFRKVRERLDSIRPALSRAREVAEACRVMAEVQAGRSEQAAENLRAASEEVFRLGERAMAPGPGFDPAKWRRGMMEVKGRLLSLPPGWTTSGRETNDRLRELLATVPEPEVAPIREFLLEGAAVSGPPGAESGIDLPGATREVIAALDRWVISQGGSIEPEAPQVATPEPAETSPRGEGIPGPKPSSEFERRSDPARESEWSTPANPPLPSGYLTEPTPGPDGLVSGDAHVPPLPRVEPPGIGGHAAVAPEPEARPEAKPESLPERKLESFPEPVAESTLEIPPEPESDISLAWSSPEETPLPVVTPTPPPLPLAPSPSAAHWDPLGTPLAPPVEPPRELESSFAPASQGPLSWTEEPAPAPALGDPVEPLAEGAPSAEFSLQWQGPMKWSLEPESDFQFDALEATVPLAPRPGWRAPDPEPVEPEPPEPVPARTSPESSGWSVESWSPQPWIREGGEVDSIPEPLAPEIRLSPKSASQMETWDDWDWTLGSPEGSQVPTPEPLSPLGSFSEPDPSGDFASEPSAWGSFSWSQESEPAEAVPIDSPVGELPPTFQETEAPEAPAPAGSGLDWMDQRERSLEVVALDEAFGPIGAETGGPAGLPPVAEVATLAAGLADVSGAFDALAGENPSDQNRSLVIFCSNDPEIWGQSVFQGEHHQARPFSEFPTWARWVSLRRLDTGERVFCPLTQEEEGGGLAPDPYGFNGNNELFYGARHLGLFSEHCPNEVETRFTYGGWGFGHRAHDIHPDSAHLQAAGWEGREIPADTVFEIVLHEALPPLGPRDRRLDQAASSGR